jgi:hypothetical protein
MNLASGSLVDARGREWVVLPGSTPELTLVRSLYLTPMIAVIFNPANSLETVFGSGSAPQRDRSAALAR